MLILELPIHIYMHLYVMISSRRLYVSDYSGYNNVDTGFIFNPI